MAEMSRLELPMDENDWPFVKSIPYEELVASPEKAQAMLHDFGCCVISGVVAPSQCKVLRQDMWQYLERRHEGFRRTDPATWTCWKGGNYGMSGRTPVVTPPFLALRQSEKLVKCFAAALQVDSSGDLIASHDRWLLYRKTEAGGSHMFRTVRNIHMDLNPWEYLDNDTRVQEDLSALRYNESSRNDFAAELNNVVGGEYAATRGMHGEPPKSVQGLVNLMDNRPEDGGTLVVPWCPATQFAPWVAAQPTKQRVRGAMQFKIEEDAPLQGQAQRVPMRAGSVLIFDGRTVHGAAPNRSDRCRFGVPVTYLRRSEVVCHAQRAQERACAVENMITASGFEAELSALGVRVFGLDVPGAKRARASANTTTTTNQKEAEMMQVASAMSTEKRDRDGDK
mmetsp:Transcript_23716/g.47141  ORF Transcript_23716/g.47141 Transcript_23716/m.47141 type:complete len:395 (+) Transcript_23716:174-1358(+)